MPDETLPLFEIKSWLNGRVLFSLRTGSLKLCVEAAVKAKADLRAADLRDADLTGAYLTDADLRAADLRAADLTGADLTGADLRAAYLTAAYLTDADLRAADLRAANLTDADLRAADLRAANLTGADLTGAKDVTLPEGVTFDEFQREVVPALLTAGGKTLDEIKASGCWECHEWSNCPMHVALGISSESQAPALLRPMVKRFVQLFDAKQLKAPWEVPAVA